MPPLTGNPCEAPIPGAPGKIHPYLRHGHGTILFIDDVNRGAGRGRKHFDDNIENQLRARQKELLPGATGEVAYSISPNGGVSLPMPSSQNGDDEPDSPPG